MIQIAIYFAQKLFEWMFKQRTEIVVLFVFIVALCITAGVLWVRLTVMDTENRIERVQIRRECAETINELRLEIRDCQAQKDTILKQYALILSELRQFKSKR